MYSSVYIDWENIEQEVKKMGSIMQYQSFYDVVKEIGVKDGHRLVQVKAYGDFDKGRAGLMSTLINLGVDPVHVVTKSSTEYLKGSADIELSLDVLEVAYRFPHIDKFIFFSGDSDLRHVVKRLIMMGKKVLIVGFEQSTGAFIKEMADGFIDLNKYSSIMRPMNDGDIENIAMQLIHDKRVKTIIKYVDTALKSKDFLALGYLNKMLKSQNSKDYVAYDRLLTNLIDSKVLLKGSIRNPKDPSNPTSTIELNEKSNALKAIKELMEVEE